MLGSGAEGAVRSARRLTIRPVPSKHRREPSAAATRPVPPEKTSAAAHAGGGDERSERPRWLVPALVGLFALVAISNAWTCDDAYILYRVADNFANGYGLRWNVAERVQVFTCPLWQLVLCVAHSVTREAYFTGLVLCLAASVGAFWLIVSRGARTAWQAVFAGIALTVSKAFVDYSTSGLENALMFLLLAGFALLALREGTEGGAEAVAEGEARGWWRRPLALSLVASLVLLNRLDALLLVGPVLGAVLVRSMRVRTTAVLAAGQAPLLLWLVFALVYYGFMLPNTYYAKLNTDYPASMLIPRGLNYLHNSLAWDPITLTMIALGVAAGVLSRRLIPVALAAGVVLYVAYVVKIGGDFMSGRFLTAPLVVSVVVLLRSAPARLPRQAWMVGAVAATVLGLVMPRSPVGSGMDGDGPARAWVDIKQWDRIADERRFYAPGSWLTALLYEPTRGQHVTRTNVFDNFRGLPDGTVLVVANIGYRGYYAGPGVYFIDPYALADPLLARIMPRLRDDFHPGHLGRAIPFGYQETLETGRNVIKDPELARFYDRLCVVTRGPIWSGERWRTIAGMMRGEYDDLIIHDRYRLPPRGGGR